jgi:predicted XRE-type DNA-binding protein
MIEHEESTGNVFTDLGLPDADEMLIKSRLVAKIAEIIEARGRAIA